jgi:hypothetical protein
MRSPGWYIAPIEILIFIRILLIAGRTDWKYPRQRTTPPGMVLVSWSVKKDRALEGYLMLGAMRTAMFNAWLD